MSSIRHPVVLSQGCIGLKTEHTYKHNNLRVCPVTSEILTTENIVILSEIKQTQFTTAYQ